MAVRPILFSGPMVCALLAGTKTQTRRVIEPTSKPMAPGQILIMTGPRFGGTAYRFAPRFAVGDLLWVREHWRTESRAYDDLAPRDMDADYPVIYEADADWALNKTVGRFRQGMHMPRWASRLTLEVTGVEVERLQDISEEDAEAEGALVPPYPEGFAAVHAIPMYQAIWKGINGPGSWDENPWVVALTFNVHRCNIDQFTPTPGGSND